MTSWRNGSASDSRSEGCVFKSRRGQTGFFSSQSTGGSRSGIQSPSQEISPLAGVLSCRPDGSSALFPPVAKTADVYGPSRDLQGAARRASEPPVPEVSPSRPAHVSPPQPRYPEGLSAGGVPADSSGGPLLTSRRARLEGPVHRSGGLGTHTRG